MTNLERSRIVCMLIFATFIMLVQSCLYTQKAPSDFSRLLNDSTRIFTGNKLLFNGAYVRNSSKKDSVYMDCPLFFFENGRVVFHYAISADSMDLANWLVK